MNKVRSFFASNEGSLVLHLVVRNIITAFISSSLIGAAVLLTGTRFSGISPWLFIPAGMLAVLALAPLIGSTGEQQILQFFDKQPEIQREHVRNYLIILKHRKHVSLLTFGAALLCAILGLIMV